ncbi:Ankyrin repeat protein 1 [Giardia duodenalis]|uniref:Ankyrin repeat protein 1 n=1 Tax=Giardia intestinalis (strain ATCC 50803 / WB clone C6) TaxID=184922 RepID=A8B204_GIAIC|nr:Ankyrin repeat protein 1 [Giardia intestinalis]KAE8302897.1 Ankyrin repeat protein 1 [Giardia intestinalis]|eukprot:XP_001709874.1 Protein 21.1 [Giardia lamblia ATCC 50803]
MATTPATVIGNHTQIVEWADPPCSAILRRDALDEDLAVAIAGNRDLLSLVKHLSHRNLLRCLSIQCSGQSNLMVWMEKASFPSLAKLLGGQKELSNEDVFGKNCADMNSFADEMDGLSHTEEASKVERELLALINDTTIEDLSEENGGLSSSNHSALVHSVITKTSIYSFAEEEVWAILAQLVSVLSYLHSSIKTGIPSEQSISINHGRIRPDTIFYDPVTHTIKLVPPHLPSMNPSSSSFAKDIYSIYIIALLLCDLCTSGVQPFESKDYQAELSSLDHRRFSPDLKQFILALRSLCLHDKPVVSNLLLSQRVTEALLPFTHLEFRERSQSSASVQTRTPLEIYRHLKEAASLPNIKHVTDPIAAERAATSQSARSVVQEHAENLSELLVVNESSIFAEHTSVMSAGNSAGYPRVASVFRDPSARETSRMDSSVDLGISVLYLSSASVGNTMLHRAVLDRDLEAVGRNLEYAKRFNQDGHTALMLCAIEGWSDGANILVFHEGGLFTKQGHTALYYALYSEHYDVARILTDVEGVSTKDPHIDALNQTDLMRATIAGDIVAVWSWLPRQHKWQDINGRTALMCAVESKASLAIIKLLVPLEAGVVDFSGRTALHRAVKMGSVDIVQLLLDLEKGKSYFSKGLEGNYVVSAKVFASELAYLYRNIDIFEVVFAAERSLILQEYQIDSDDDSIDRAVANDYQRLLNAVENYLEFEVFLWVSELGNTGGDGYTALMHASASKYFAAQNGVKRDTYQEYALYNIVKLLLKEAGQHLIATSEALPDTVLLSRADTSSINPFVPGATALIIAAICDDVAIIPLLLEHEKGLHDDTQRTALMWAARYNNSAAVKLLAPHEKTLTNGRPYYTALYVAIEHGNENIAKILTPYEGYPDADLASRIQGRHTELMQAAENGDLPGVWSYRFQLGLQDKRGYTALMYACIFGDINCILQLRHEEHLVAKDGTTARALLEQHWREENPQIVDMLDIVEVFDDKGMNQLQRAIRKQDPELILRFLHLQDRTKELDGLTVLMQVIELGLTDLVDVIIREYPTQLGRTVRSYPATKVLWEDVTALMIAASHGYDGAVVALAETPEARMKDSGKGRTALMAAAINGHASTVSLLIDKEARMQNAEGWTALMYAAAYNMDEVVSVLIPAEAQVQMKDGWTALMTAARNGHLQAASLLLPYEAGLLKKSKYSALYYASTHGHTEMVTLLLSEEREKKYARFILEALSKRCPEVAIVNLQSTISLLQSSIL